MALTRVTERVYIMPYEEKADRPNIGYIRGDACSVAVDAGNSPAHVKKFYDELDKEGLPRPKYTIVTHWHWDHTFGLCAVEGLSIASARTNEKLREVQLWQWNEEAMKERELTGKDTRFCNICIKQEYEKLSDINVVPAMGEINSPRVLDIGGVTVRLIPRDSPHSRDSLFVYAAEEKVIFVGDSDSPDFYDKNKMDNDRLKSLIDFYKGLDFAFHIHGHDEPCSKEEIISRLSLLLTPEE